MTTTRSRRSRARRAGGLPAVLVLPALAGLAFLVVPLAGLVVEAPWDTLLERLADPAVLGALRLSLVTASAATVLCLVFGVPLAWLLARSELPGLRRAGPGDGAAGAPRWSAGWPCCWCWDATG